MTHRLTADPDLPRAASSHAPPWAPRLDETVDGIVRVVLPDFPSLDPDLRGAVERDVSQYVIRLIRSLPSFLRLPYSLVTFAFEWCAVLRHGRRFRSLPPDDRSSYVTRWSAAPVRPMRDFVRLIRGSALLAYFDHALVTEKLAEERQGALASAQPRSAARA